MWLRTKGLTEAPTKGEKGSIVTHAEHMERNKAELEAEVKRFRFKNKKSIFVREPVVEIEGQWYPTPPPYWAAGSFPKCLGCDCWTTWSKRIKDGIAEVRKDRCC